MIRDRRLWAAVSVFVLGGGALYYCSAPPDDGNGGPDGSTDQVAEPVEDTAVDVPANDAPANDATEPDAASDATTEDVTVQDAATDALLEAASDAIADVTGDADATLLDAGVFVVTACYLQAPVPNANAQIVTSEGKVYRTSSFTIPPTAGTPVQGSWGTLLTTLSPANLAALLASAQTVQASDAGTTTTVGTIQHQTTRDGKLYSAGAPGNTPILVHSLLDGINAGKRTEVIHNDPAATVVRNRGGCFEGE